MTQLTSDAASDSVYSCYQETASDLHRLVIELVPYIPDTAFEMIFVTLTTHS